MKEDLRDILPNKFREILYSIMTSDELNEKQKLDLHSAINVLNDDKITIEEYIRLMLCAQAFIIKAVQYQAERTDKMIEIITEIVTTSDFHKEWEDSLISMLNEIKKQEK